MKYMIIMSDTIKDERIEAVVEADSVFDAINVVEIKDPQNTELIEAYPID